MRIAFHPTMKAPDHPVPSGDREMARLLVAALRAGGHEVDLPSPLRSYVRDSAPGGLAALVAAAEMETARLLAHWRRAPAPDLWFTYHLYYKSPDLLGPRVARALGAPYVAAEASWARKRALDEWAPWQAAAEAAMAACQVIFTYTDRDAAGLREAPNLKAHIARLPPFLDFVVDPAPPPPRRDGPTRLLASAMMRPGNKTESYLFLAQALTYVAPSGWVLDIIGDGAARAQVARAFARFPAGQIRFHGLLDRAATRSAMAQADIFVWPGLREAYGMVYLEAQACGVPVVALDSGGASATFAPGRTGLLVQSLTPQAYGEAVATLMRDAPLRARMGAAARRFIEEERNVAAAAAILNRGFEHIWKCG